VGHAEGVILIDQINLWAAWLFQSEYY
jgi:hypothetical protein